MLVSFSVSNFRSFSTEQTFSLVASKRLSGSHENHAVAIPDSDEQVLRTGVIYGANGAGKSNLFKALRYVESSIFKSRGRHSGTEREPFLFDGSAGGPSTFDLQFVANNKLYRYGFSVDDIRVAKEWLVNVVGTKEKPIFERVTSDIGKVIVELPEGSSTSGKLKALATVGGPQNQLFLATIELTLDEDDLGADLQSVLQWFRALTLIAPNANYGPLGHKLSREPEFLTFAGDFLRASSTGVDHLVTEKKEISEDELRALLPDDLASQVLSDLTDDDDPTSLISIGEGKELLVERGDGNHFYRITIQAEHKKQDGSYVPLNLGQESDGTKRLLNLLPALHHLRTSAAVYFIDEIDRSMHPILVIEFLKSFLQCCEDGDRQIIVTTHESNLLSLDLLRRDEIWFAEKDASGATQLYSLMDFRVRNDLQIRKHYLQGRFGAIPFLGSLDSLVRTESASG